MIQKLADRVNSFPTGRATRDNNALPALRDRWRLIHEVRKIVPVNFFLDCSEQNGFLHGSNSWWCAEERGSRSLARLIVTGIPHIFLSPASSSYGANALLRILP